MKEQIENAVTWLKEQDIKGCITGSCLLDYFEGQDIDIFCYTEASFTKLLYTLYFNKMFLITEPLEEWKFNDWVEKDYKTSIKKLGLITIKFKYNMCIDVNIIYKKDCNNIFSVLKTFDLNIICKGFDLETKQYLDLTNSEGKLVHFNRWNTSLESVNLWSIGRILRQFERVIKYHKRGYNTDPVVHTYKYIIDKMINQENIFSSKVYESKLSNLEENGIIIKKIMDKWLKTHKISDSELELIKEKIKEL